MTSALGVTATFAGCSGDSGGEEADVTATTSPESSNSPEPTESSVTQVDVGPEKRLRFEPDEVEIRVGETVEWTAKSVGHNVTSHPDASPKCENPEGADPFTSYEGNDHFSIMDVDEQFKHEFTVPGEYVYVCTPHAGQGMVGTVVVTE